MKKIVKMLLDKDANVNAHNEIDGNALHSASAKKYDKIVHLLLDKGANVNAQTELFWRCTRGQHRRAVMRM